MKLSTFLVIKAVICIVFAILLGLIPSAWAAQEGYKLDTIGTVFARTVGACLVGIGLICWFSRWAPDSDLRRGILLSLFVGDVIGFIVVLVGQLSGILSVMGWFSAAIWLLLALGLGYFRFFKPAAS